MGFLAPYAYVRVALLQVQPLKLLAEESVTVNSAHSAGPLMGNKVSFDAFSTARRLELLRDLVEQGVGQAATQALKALP